MRLGDWRQWSYISFETTRASTHMHILYVRTKKKWKDTKQIQTSGSGCSIPRRSRGKWEIVSAEKISLSIISKGHWG